MTQPWYFDKEQILYLQLKNIYLTKCQSFDIVFENFVRSGIRSKVNSRSGCRGGGADRVQMKK